MSREALIDSGVRRTLVSVWQLPSHDAGVAVSDERETS